MRWEGGKGGRLVRREGGEGGGRGGSEMARWEK